MGLQLLETGKLTKNKGMLFRRKKCHNNRILGLKLLEIGKMTQNKETLFRRRECDEGKDDSMGWRLIVYWLCFSGLATCVRRRGGHRRLWWDGVYVADLLCFRRWGSERVSAVAIIFVLISRFRNFLFFIVRYGSKLANIDICICHSKRGALLVDWRTWWDQTL